MDLDGMRCASRYLKDTDEVKVVSAGDLGEAVITASTLTGVANLSSENIVLDHLAGTTSSGQAAMNNASFAECDAVVLIDYERNSFKGVWQGDELDVNSAGDRARINSVTDPQESAATSPRVSGALSGDTPTLHITRTAGVLDIVPKGLGQSYRSTYDSMLF